MSTYNQIQRWRIKARKWITLYCGNCCQVCGYDRYIGNLIFHHLDPTTKSDTVSRLINSTSAWATIINEANKCVLVCCNCHGEIHAGLITPPTIDTLKRRETLESIITTQPLPLTKQFHKCICSKIIPKTKEFCSQKCHHRNSESIRWPEDLPELVNRTSKRAVALTLGVSDKAVAKRLKNHHTEPVTGLEPAMDFSGSLQNCCTANCATPAQE